MDLWLVRAVGLLISVVGAVIALAAWRGRQSAEVTLLATGSAAALAVVDVVYVVKGRISRVYLLDALGEGVLLAGWAWLLRDSSSQ